jgi:hypothetical protein
MNHGIFGNAWLGATEPPAAPGGPPPEITERPPTTTIGRDGLPVLPVQGCVGCAAPGDKCNISTGYHWCDVSQSCAPPGQECLKTPCSSTSVMVGQKCIPLGPRCMNGAGDHWCESTSSCLTANEVCPSAPVPPASEISQIDQTTKWLVLGGVAVLSFGIAALLIKKA